MDKIEALMQERRELLGKLTDWWKRWNAAVKENGDSPNLAADVLTNLDDAARNAAWEPTRATSTYAQRIAGE